MRPIGKLIWSLIAGLMIAGPAGAVIDTKAEYAILMDGETGIVLFEKNADELMAPASMSKLMTMEYLFHKLKQGEVALTDEFVISPNAWKKGGAASGSSTMFAKVNSKIPVEALVRGVVVQSGNDASIAIAEALGGTEEGYAQLLTERARELGLKKSTFANATGWPDPQQRMTARELAMLARHIIRTYPKFYRYYSETEFTWNGIKQGNRNPLLYSFPGADGLKTGHTDESGYGLAASAMRDGQRLVLVVNGLDSINERAEEAKRLMTLGFATFSPYRLLKAGEVVGEGKVWMGEQKTVPLAVGEDIMVILDRPSRRKMKVTLTYDGPLRAPVESGRQVGTLTVSAPGMKDVVTPVRTAGSVAQLGLTDKLGFALMQLMFGDLEELKNSGKPKAAKSAEKASAEAALNE